MADLLCGHSVVRPARARIGPRAPLASDYPAAAPNPPCAQGTLQLAALLGLAVLAMAAQQGAAAASSSSRSILTQGNEPVANRLALHNGEIGKTRFAGASVRSVRGRGQPAVCTSLAR